jgi:hypothetical protein
MKRGRWISKRTFEVVTVACGALTRKHWKKKASQGGIAEYAKPVDDPATHATSLASRR